MKFRSVHQPVPVELAQELLDQYVNGQVRVAGLADNIVYHAQLKSIEVSEPRARVLFGLNWCVSSEPSDMKRWRSCGISLFSVGLQNATAMSIGSSTGNRADTGEPFVSGDRVRIDIVVDVKQTMILYPPGGYCLDPSQVEGLS